MAFRRNVPLDNVIIANEYRAYWGKSKDNITYFNKTSLIDALKTLIDNTYFTFGNQVFKQIIGIPMGTDCAPFIANLFLWIHEFKFIRKLQKERNFKEALKLRHTYRYIDDSTSINDDGTFDKYYKEIYPNSLQLEKINKSYNAADVLDMNITINNNKFYTKLYDKRNDFNFEITNFPHIHGNISISMCKGIIYSQILRYSCINTNFNCFIHSITNLFKKLITRAYSRRLLKHQFYKTIHKNKEILHKYNQTNITEVWLRIANAIK